MEDNGGIPRAQSIVSETRTAAPGASDGPAAATEVVGQATSEGPSVGIIVSIAAAVIGLCVLLVLIGASK